MKKIFRPLIAIILLVLLLKTGLIKIDQLKEALQNVNLLVSGFFLIGLQFLFFAIRWKIIVDFYKVIPFKIILKLNLISQFFNIFIPGGIGGDLVKAIELSKTEHIPRQKTITTILIDRVLGLYCMIIFSTLFLLLELSQPFEIKKYFYTSLTMLLISTFGLFFLKRMTEFAHQISESLNYHFIKKIVSGLQTLTSGFNAVSKFKTLLQIIGISFVTQLFAIVYIYIVVTSLVPTPPTFLLFFPLACFAFMASSIPITPGGIGFGQAAFYFIFSIFSRDVANAVVIGISLMQLFTILFSLPGAYFFTKIPKRTNQTKPVAKLS